MGNQSTQSTSSYGNKRNVLIVGSERLEEKYILDKFFSQYRIEQTGVLESMKVTTLAISDESEILIWLLRFNDLNFENTLSILTRTLEITSVIVCFMEENSVQAKQVRQFIQKHLNDEYLRGISLGILALEEDSQYQRNNGNGMFGEGITYEQQQQIQLFMRRRKIEDNLDLRSIDPRIMKQIQIINILQIGKLNSQITEFVQKVLEAAEMSMI